MGCVGLGFTVKEMMDQWGKGNLTISDQTMQALARERKTARERRRGGRMFTWRR
jgi:hypothetical protein